MVSHVLMRIPFILCTFTILDILLSEDMNAAIAEPQINNAGKKVKTAKKPKKAFKKAKRVLKALKKDEEVTVAKEEVVAAKKKVAAAKDVTAKEEAEKGLAQAKWDLAKAERAYAMAMRDLVILDPKAGGKTDWEAEVVHRTSGVNALRDAYHKLVNPSAFSTSSVVSTAGTLIDNVHV
jgi:hypothetical protein